MVKVMQHLELELRGKKESLVSNKKRSIRTSQPSKVKFAQLMKRWSMGKRERGRERRGGYAM